MTHHSHNELQRLSEAVAAKMGLHFPEGRHVDLVRGLRAAAPAFGFDDPSECARWLIATPLTRERVEILASCLSVGETYFFRDSQALAALREQVLPTLIAARRGAQNRLRLWSAGCSTGEEAYSLAILLDELVPDIASWDILVLATDINPEFLRTAQRGVYREWSFRECPPHVRAKYFRPSGPNQFEILPALRNRVTFEYLNLADDPYPALLNNTNAMDLILCRNVLMYFERETAQRITVKFAHCLVDGGRLVVSPSEAWTATAAELEAECPGATTVFRRRTGTAAPAPRPAGTPTRRRQHAPWKRPDATTAYDVAYRRAVACFDQGLYSETVTFLTTSEKCAHGSLPAADRIRVMTLLARAYANLGVLAKAEKWCRRAIAIDRSDAGMHYLLATILQEEGRIDDARNAFGATLCLDPAFALAHFSLGALARQAEDPRTARRHFDNALELLANMDPRTEVPHSEGLPAGRLVEIIHQQESEV